MRSADEYADLMNNLKLANPKMMDVAVPANMKIGMDHHDVDSHGWSLSVRQVFDLMGRPDVALIDLREDSERQRHGVIPSSLHFPYPALAESISAGGVLHELGVSTTKRLVFYCAFGERSAMAVQAAHDAGIASACHIEGGIDAWKKANGPVTH